MNTFWGLNVQHGDYNVVQMVKNLPAMGETQVQSLDQEDPLEKEYLDCDDVYMLECIKKSIKLYN